MNFLFLFVFTGRGREVHSNSSLSYRDLVGYTISFSLARKHEVWKSRLGLPLYFVLFCVDWCLGSFLLRDEEAGHELENLVGV